MAATPFLIPSTVYFFPCTSIHTLLVTCASLPATKSPFSFLESSISPLPFQPRSTSIFCSSHSLSFLPRFFLYTFHLLVTSSKPLSTSFSSKKAPPNAKQLLHFHSSRKAPLPSFVLLPDPSTSRFSHILHLLFYLPSHTLF